MLLSALAMFFAALLHEDVAIVTASFFVAKGEVPFVLALGVVYGGVVMNNCGVYATGAMARRVPALHRRLVGGRIERLGSRLRVRAVTAVLLCRLAPGFVFPTFFGCGWFGVRFARFAPTAAAAAAVYVSIMFTLVVTFGRVALERFSEGIWFGIGAVVVAAVVGIAGRRYANARRRRETRYRALVGAE